MELLHGGVGGVELGGVLPNRPLEESKEEGMDFYPITHRHINHLGPA